MEELDVSLGSLKLNSDVDSGSDAGTALENHVGVEVPSALKLHSNEEWGGKGIHSLSLSHTDALGLVMSFTQGNIRRDMHTNVCACPCSNRP